jgi:predicted ester cyclase
MSAGAHATAVHTWAEDLWNEGKLEVADEIAAPDYAFLLPGFLSEQRGPAGLKGAVQLFRGPSPDLHFTIEDEIAEGDTVVSRWTARGTHSGEFMGIAPMGKRVTVCSIDILRFVDGKIRENWAEFDALGLLRQLGAVAAPVPASA